VKTIAIIAALTLTIAASADPPGRRVCRTPFIQQTATYQQVIPHSINAATIYADTHLNIVEVPVPAFVFQTLTAYQPTVQVQQNAVAMQPVAVDGIGTDDQLAALLGASPSQANAMTPLAEIAQKCGSCHSAGAAKAGLTLLDAAGQYSPSTTKNNALTRSLIALCARSTGEDAMPPGVNTNPAKRLSENAIRFLEQ